jgi:two-component system OmpR family sensor kinase
MGGKERLFDLLIHDLTSPLSIVSTSVTHLLQKTDRYGPVTDQQRHILERILRNNRKAQSLLQEMVEVLRSKEGLFQKELFPIEETLRESILDVLEMTVSDEAEKLCRTESQGEFKNIFESQGIFIEITGKYCHHPFCHDQKKIQQILRNLLSNAMRHRQKRIDLSISGEMDLLILVKDDGQGIPERDQQIIFQRFIRLNDKKNTESPGLGLGLAGVKTLVEAMGGEITVESREGFGTQFVVKIPPLQS